MDRNSLIDMVQSGTSLVRHFLYDSDSAACSQSSFEDWNDTDAVGHIISWMDYSIDKLSSIKLGTAQSAEYANAASLADINQMIYAKNAGKTREEIESAYISAEGRYIAVISLFLNSEMDSTAINTGFKMPLWRYMLMDTVIHPVQHVLYQLLKHKEYRKTAALIARTHGIFSQYTPDSSAYKLSEFELHRPEYQKRITELEKEYSSDAHVMNFIRMNRCV